ncbi:nucleoredoxin-like [Harmonia axyridis]|uniref:nucleoredoxin-like n=1 Tax=Harmonia axyridis TaxID=115357 RepID=UPI001E276738|nr:nucleoredoxin-like [Harmonia axyridis]
MEPDQHKWQDKLLGERLMRCSNSCDVDFPLTETSKALEKADVVGLYFSFANINSKSDELTCQMLDLYSKLNGEDGNDGKRMEVVQVVLWVNNDVYSGFEANHRECLIGLPWFALPFDEVELKARLSRRYRIKSGVPTLVLLDKDGSTISISAQDKLLEDPHGLNFPWRPRPVEQVLKDVTLLPGGIFFSEHQNTEGNIFYRDIPDGIKGFYFSANWCPPCRAFTPQLVDMYKLVRKKEPNFEIIFVSSDRSPESFSTCVGYMPWLAVPFQQSAVRAELAQLYGIRGIPTLLLLDSNGHVITMDARTELAEDPLAQNFPWKPRAVNVLTERYAAKLQDFPAIILFVDGEETELHFAESVLTPAADGYYKKHNINFTALHEDFLLCVKNENYLQFLIGLDSETSDIVRDLVGLDDVVPLLVGIDIPNRRFAVMEYGVELTVDSCTDFVEKFKTGNVKFIDINKRMSQKNDEN